MSFSFALSFSFFILLLNFLFIHNFTCVSVHFLVQYLVPLFLFPPTFTCITPVTKREVNPG